MTSEILLTVASAALIFLGIIGTALPFLPGPPLAFAGILLYGFAIGFSNLSATALIVFALLTVFTFILDFLAPGLGAKGFKASKYGFWGTLFGTFAGVILFGPMGIFLGPFLGAFLGELYAKKTAPVAVRTAWGAFVGFLVGTVIKLVIVFAMAGYFGYLLFR